MHVYTSQCTYIGVNTPAGERYTLEEGVQPINRNASYITSLGHTASSRISQDHACSVSRAHIRHRGHMCNM